jgi:hypothetical protein
MINGDVRKGVTPLCATDRRRGTEASHEEFGSRCLASKLREHVLLANTVVFGTEKMRDSDVEIRMSLTMGLNGHGPRVRPSYAPTTLDSPDSRE